MMCMSKRIEIKMGVSKGQTCLYLSVPISADTNVILEESGMSRGKSLLMNSVTFAVIMNELLKLYLGKNNKYINKSFVLDCLNVDVLGMLNAMNITKITRKQPIPVRIEIFGNFLKRQQGDMVEVCMSVGVFFDQIIFSLSDMKELPVDYFAEKFEKTWQEAIIAMKKETQK